MIGRRCWGIVAAALTAFAAPTSIAAAQTTGASDRPIVIALVIDGLGPEELPGNAPFMTSLLHGTEGSPVYRYRDSRSIMIAETNPNHIAMVTGAYAADSGIPGNTFAIYAPTEDPNNCRTTGPIDESKRPSVATGEDFTCPSAESVFQAVRRQGNPDGLLTAGIFGKAKLARFFAQPRPGGGFAADHLWAPCTPSGPDYEDEYCGSVPIEPVQRDRTLSDTIVMDEVLQTIREGVGPDRRIPDFTFVNLPNVDNAGHAFGGGGTIYDLAIRLADAEVRRLVTDLKSRDLWKRTVLMIVSDHSHETTLNKPDLSGRFAGGGIPKDSFLTVVNGSVDMVYLANRTDPARFELLKRMRRLALDTPGVNEALYREPNPLDGGSAHTIDGRHPDWHAAGPRTGDLLITANPGNAFSDADEEGRPNALIGQHGAPQTRDNFFAVVGGGPFVRSRDSDGFTAPDFDDTARNPAQAENVDLASTVMGLFGLNRTANDRGRFLSEAFSLDALPGAGRPVPPALTARRGSAVDGRRRYTLRYGPAGSVFDLQIRRGRTWRRLYRASPNISYTIRLKPRRGYRFRVRSKAASGRHSEWSGLSVRAR